MKFIQILIILIINFLIASCANLPSQKVLQPLWETHQKTMQHIDKWKLNGRIVINDEKNAWNARVTWLQQATDYQLVFNSPLGGAMRLIGSQQQVIMQTADNETFSAETAEQLVRDVLNMEIPVQNLYYWIRGMPAPSHKKLYYVLNEKGQLQLLEQQGWTVDFKRYAYVSSLAIPDKIFLYNNDYRLKIVINKWQL